MTRTVYSDSELVPLFPDLTLAGAGTTLLLGLATWGLPAAAQAAESKRGPLEQGSAEGEAATDPPRPLAVAVTYPPEGSGDASVELELLIGKDGAVLESKVLSGSEPFARAAQSQALTWQFRPAFREGQPVEARIRYQVTFRGVTLVPTEEPLPEQASPTTQPSEIVVTTTGERLNPGAASIGQAEARQLPGAFGDPFRAVEALPGVTPVASGLPFFFVRGAPPGNVGYFLDGVGIPLLYHAFLGPQVIHPALISEVVLFRAAPPARFGRYSGAIISATTVPPPSRPGGEARVRLLDAGALVHAPYAGGEGHALLAGRYSYTGLLATLFSDVTVQYWDYQARVGQKVASAHRAEAFGFGAFDYFKGPDGDFVGSEFHRLDLRHTWEAAPETTLQSAVTFGVDRSRSTLGAVANRTLGVRFEFSHPLSESAKLSYGASGSLEAFHFNVRREAANFDDLRQLFPTRTDHVAGAYAEAEVRSGRVRLVPGVRVDRYGSLDDTAVGVDPRISAGFSVTPQVELVHGLGLLHQPPGFLPEVPGAKLAGLRGGLQTSLQHSFGVVASPSEQLALGVTLFQSAFFDLNDPLGTLGKASADIESRDTRAQGYARGLEVELSRPLTERLSGNVSYTLSRNERSRGAAQGVAAFDRTHLAQLGTMYRFGPGYSAGARALYYSGVPTRRLTDSGPRYDQSDRAAPMLRLDLRAERRFTLGPDHYFSVHLELLNATLSREVVRRECGPRSCTEDVAGPFTLPNVGVEIGF